MSYAGTFLQLLNADPERWARRHNIVPLTTGCYGCEAECTTTVPIFKPGVRGLMALPCKCGHPWPPFCMVVVDGPLAGQQGVVRRRRTRRKP